MTVIKAEVNMLRVPLFETWTKNWTIDWERSNTVCLQVNAIVNPKVSIRMVLICFMNSFLYLLPKKNLSEILSFIPKEMTNMFIKFWRNF